MPALSLAELNRDKAASLLMPNVPADAEAGLLVHSIMSNVYCLEEIARDTRLAKDDAQALRVAQTLIDRILERQE